MNEMTKQTANCSQAMSSQTIRVLVFLLNDFHLRAKALLFLFLLLILLLRMAKIVILEQYLLDLSEEFLQSLQITNLTLHLLTEL
jgi:hypothetical protein